MWGIISFLEKQRARSYNERKRFAFFVSLGTTLCIASLWATIRFVSFGDESQRQGVLETQTATPATAFERMQDSLQETSANHEDMMYESENREGATDTPPTSPLSPTPTETAGGQKNTFITPIPATL